jgi:hypothetical protein
VKRTAPAQSSPTGEDRSPNGEASDTWNARPHRASTASLSGRSPQSHGVIAPSPWLGSTFGIEIDSGVVWDRAR